MVELNKEITTLDQVYDIIKNGHSLSFEVPYFNSKKTHGKIMNLSLGRTWINIILPDDYELIDEVVNQKRLNTLVKDLFNKYGPGQTADYISKLQSEAFKLASLVPNTFNIDVFIPPEEWTKKKEEFENREEKNIFMQKKENFYKSTRRHISG